MTMIHLAKKIATLLRDLIVLVILVALFAVSLYGVKTSPQKSVSIGPYQLSVFDSGLAIYSQGRKTPYWNISPLNDYYLTKDGKKEIFLSGREFSEGKFESSFEKEKFEEFRETIEYFLGKKELVYEMRKPTLDVTYKAQLDGKRISIERHIKNLVQKDIVATGITIRFSADDLIYDPRTNIFIYYPDPQDIFLFERFIKKPVILYERRQDEYLVTVDSGQVVLVNKYLPGALLITADEGQRLVVDTRHRVILTEEQVKDGDEIKTNLNLRVFDSVEELGRIYE